MLRIALAQSESTVGTETFDPRDDNLERAVRAVDTAAGQGAQLVVFGELYLQGYGTEEWLYKWASRPRLEDRHIAALADVARARKIHLIVGAATFGDFMPGDLYNSAVIIGPDGVIGVYRKCHVAAMVRGNVSAERSFYSPGKDLPVFDTTIGRLGVNICYDAMFPEVARVQALKGAELLVNVTAQVEGREEAHRHLAYVRASENASWYAVCSVVGRQRRHNLYGGSRLVDPVGRFVAEAKCNEEDVLIADIDLDFARQTRSTLHTFSMRQPDLYSAISERSPTP